MTTVENIRSWLRGCPEIASDRYFTVDCINDDPDCYAISLAPSPISYKRDITGEMFIPAEQIVNYYFLASVEFSFDPQVNIANIAALERVVNWLYDQNFAKNFPDIAEGTVLTIMPTLTPYPVVQGASRAIYRISLQLKYRRK